MKVTAKDLTLEEKVALVKGASFFVCPELSQKEWMDYFVWMVEQV